LSDHEEHGRARERVSERVSERGSEPHRPPTPFIDTAIASAAQQRNARGGGECADGSGWRQVSEPAPPALLLPLRSAASAAQRQPATPTRSMGGWSTNCEYPRRAPPVLVAAACLAEPAPPLLRSGWRQWWVGQTVGGNKPQAGMAARAAIQVNGRPFLGGVWSVPVRSRRRGGAGWRASRRALPPPGRGSTRGVNAGLPAARRRAAGLWKVTDSVLCFIMAVKMGGRTVAVQL
jgi:hypothetical protein